MLFCRIIIFQVVRSLPLISIRSGLQLGMSMPSSLFHCKGGTNSAAVFLHIGVPISVLGVKAASLFAAIPRPNVEKSIPQSCKPVLGTDRCVSTMQQCQPTEPNQIIAACRRDRFTLGFSTALPTYDRCKVSVPIIQDGDDKVTIEGNALSVLSLPDFERQSDVPRRSLDTYATDALCLGSRYFQDYDRAPVSALLACFE